MQAPVGQFAVGFLARVAGNLLFLNLESREGFQHVVQGVKLGRAELSGVDDEGLRGVDGLLGAVDAGSGVFHSGLFLSSCRFVLCCSLDVAVWYHGLIFL